jgi:DNA mismatch endonuclease (patch repair protein)
MSNAGNVSSLRQQKLFVGEPLDPNRSALMARIRDKHSKPELAVRRMAHGLGYRFRLHCHDLPGTPDLVFPRLRKTIFVHGCFWHRHKGCSRTTSPKTRSKYWADKFETNIKRDRVKERTLRALGWDVLVIWECQTFDPNDLSKRIAKFCSRDTRR